MFMSWPGSLQQAMRQIDKAETEDAFENAICGLRNYLKSIEAETECLMEVEKRAYYLPNSYSEKDTKEKIEQAKRRIQEYISEMMNDSCVDKRLLSILENFYLFMEGLIEREPHKRASIQKEQLEMLKIKNEYDVQHLFLSKF